MSDLAADLRRDADLLAPVPNEYSPFGVSYGFITDVLANMAMARLVGQPSAGLSLEDVFQSHGRSIEKLDRARGWQRLPTRPGEQEHFSHSDAWAAQMQTRVAIALDARVSYHSRPNASSLRDGRIAIATGAAGVEGVPAVRDGVRCDAFCVTTDAPRAEATGAAVCTEVEFRTDHNEARFLASAEVDGHCFGVSKVLLTLVLGQGRDAVLTDPPAAVVDVLRLTCPGLIEAAESQAS